MKVIFSSLSFKPVYEFRKSFSLGISVKYFSNKKKFEKDISRGIDFD